METATDTMAAYISRQKEFRRQEADRDAMRKIQADHDKRTAESAKSEAELQLEDLRKMNFTMLQQSIDKAKKEIRKRREHLNDLSDPEVYRMHVEMFMWVANNVVLAPQNRKFIVDENNKRELRFLLLYFNGCPQAEGVFPDRGYKLHKNILLQGDVGCGKTLMMQAMSEYLRLTDNPNFFYNMSVTQMVNYYTLHNNLDRYTYNEEENRGFQCSPVNICLNDIGVQTTSFYGMDTRRLTDEFLHARNEIWVNYHKFAHLTTNLDNKQLAEAFKDSYGRLVDRFKTYNIIPLTGPSRR